MENRFSQLRLAFALAASWTLVVACGDAVSPPRDVPAPDDSGAPPADGRTFHDGAATSADAGDASDGAGPDGAIVAGVDAIIDGRAVAFATASCVRFSGGIRGQFYQLNGVGDARVSAYASLSLTLPSLAAGSYVCNSGQNQVELALMTNTSPTKSYVDLSQCQVEIRSTCANDGYVRGAVSSGLLVNSNDGSHVAVSDTFTVPCVSASFGTCP